ncbi:MAG TPA: hypothetical protein VIJ28_02030, partial [Chloroflexota bacterium]
LWGPILMSVNVYDVPRPIAAVANRSGQALWQTGLSQIEAPAFAPGSLTAHLAVGFSPLSRWDV